MHDFAEKAAEGLYIENFHDYDDILKVPPGWVDTSNYADHDTCPSISREIMSKDGWTGKSITILEDYKDPSLRENPDDQRYAVFLLNDQGNFTQYCGTDSFDEALDVAERVETLFSENHLAKGQEKAFFDSYHEKAIHDLKTFDEPFEDEPYHTAVAAATEALANNALQADVHDWLEKYAPCAKLQPPVMNPLGLSYSDSVIEQALKTPEVQKIIGSDHTDDRER